MEATNNICRMESISKSKVAILQNSYDCVQYARQVATVKNLQTDSRPFYVMNVGKVNTLLDVWISVLPRVRPFYAVNCNSDSVLMQVLADKPHIGFYCRTKENVEKALQFSVPERVFYSNACWTRSTVAHAASNAIGLIAFDSARDLNRIAVGYPNAELMLNLCVNADAEDANAALGCSLDEAPELLQLVCDMGLNCVGVSFTVGAGINYAEAASMYSRAIKDVACLFDFACTRLGMQLNVLNIGGGFSLMGSSAGFQQVSEQINISLDYYFPREFNADLQIIATPGRFFAESTYSLVTNIIGCRSVDASHVTNDDFDTGTEAFIYHTNEGYYGSFGCRIDANCKPQCVPLFDNFMDNVTSEHVYGSVHGPTMDQQFDVLQSLCRFRPLRVGEWLIWANMGAYTLNNRGNLDGNSSDDDATNSPNIFYFSSHDDWSRLQCQVNQGEAGKGDKPGDGNNNGEFCDNDEIARADLTGKDDDGFKNGKDAKTMLLLEAVDDEDEGIGSGNELDECFLMLDDEGDLDDFLIELDDDIFAAEQYFRDDFGDRTSGVEQHRKCSRIIK